MTDPQNNAFRQLLASYGTDSKGHKTGQRDRGTGFETLVQIYFREEPKFSSLYSEVLTYAEWARQDPERGSARDTGIDLVGVRRDGSGFEAIQAKFYKPDHRISRKEIDSFVTASNRAEFTGRRLVTTTGNWGDNANEVMNTVQPAIELTTLEDLENSVIDWGKYLQNGEVTRREAKALREEQKEAVEKTIAALSDGSVDAPAKGRLLMACGTGKTFTSLKIAEALGGKGKIVLFLAPSLHLISQTLTEWTQQSSMNLDCFAVCSDSEVGKKRDDDMGRVENELNYPATTDAASLARQVLKARSAPGHEERMVVIFSTYHSSPVIGEAQKLEVGLPDIDLVICDEAHRTSGFEKEGDDKAFQFIHKPDGIRTARKLFMTATPRIYSSEAMEKAKDIDTTLYSMDNAELYGPIIYEITFADAIRLEWLCPYKIVVLGVSENEVAGAVPDVLRDASNGITIDIASRIIGAWKGLSREDMRGENEIRPMHRAVAFCSTIEPSKKRVGTVASKVIASGFSDVVDEYRRRHGDEGALCEVRHVDGSMNAAEKGERLDWLKADPDPIIDEKTGEKQEVCRILSNVRCLSEGVDVPALDAVIFLAPTNSEVDVVQSVGRVMRRAPGKTRGYIIIPVVVPNGQTEEDYFSHAGHHFRTVWTVLQALRAHDSSLDDEMDRFNMTGTLDFTRMEVVCTSSTIATGRKKSAAEKLEGKLKKEKEAASPEEIQNLGEQLRLSFIERRELADALYARIVKRVGNRNPFKRWTKDVKRIVNRHIIAIERLINGALDEDREEQHHATQRASEVFNHLKSEIHSSINPNIPDSEIIEMLGQHLVTGPVFDALFGESGSHSSNPMTQALDAVTQQLYEAGLAKEQEGLEGFYESIRNRLYGATPEVRQAWTIRLYNDFFKEAFKKQSDKLGIVFTPVPIVDFIIRSVEHVLQSNFGCGLGDEKVSVLDPFTGTGSFIARMIELRHRHPDGSEGDYLISDEQLRRKYKAARKEEALHGRPGLWANELVLLAYYVAGINIATSYATRTGEQEPFGGLCLTDTFNLTENLKAKQGNLDVKNGYLKDNSERILAQETARIKVIIGNPPYSAGAKTAGGTQNEKYEYLDQRIEETYVKDSQSTNKNSLYDSYIRAIRWASDRIEEEGVIGFVTNAGFIESAAATGLRNALQSEFSDIWIFHLRGDARTSGELRRQEKDNVFGQGSRAPVALTILARRKDHGGKGVIRFCDIGDFLSAHERYAHGGPELETAPSSDKFCWLHHFGSIAAIPDQAPDALTETNPEGLFRRWQIITPDEHGDWLSQRDDSFADFMTMGSKKGEQGIFSPYSNGLKTQRDGWVYNFSKEAIKNSVSHQVETYEGERARLNEKLPKAKKDARLKELAQSPDFESHDLSWTTNIQDDVATDKSLKISDGEIRVGEYRPFTREWVFFSRRLNERVYQLPKIFPEAHSENRVICLAGLSKNLPPLMVKEIPDLHLIGDSQCFPFYYYEETKQKTSKDGLFTEEERQDSSSTYRCKSAITPEGMAYFRKAWPEASLNEEDVFYYIYGLLHSPDYRSRYATSLSKELPRIPCVRKEHDFWVFSKTGRALAERHLTYEEAEPYFALNDSIHIQIKPGKTDEETFRVEKMAFGKKTDEKGKRTNDRSVLIYNKHVTVTGIPEEAYEYVVNGKPALEWVMERQQVKTDKRSKITNDPNCWGLEEKHNPAWPLLLFLKVMTVSLKTQKLIKSFPTLDIV
ncbi:DEAD/DEAH box helicase family protein [Acetobacteraceae bacterium ESL0709]|nr:DEAD/DEAH box helicase family protein [Acetobacteraceae bacterium ESL0697]MDF7678760.1 DEAD/DEAH box helicase family protein [Acetobacteraceae bacterium ESL0709]